MSIDTQSISSKTFLVTGGAGFIGSHLSEFLVKNGAKKVVVLDDLSTGFKKNLEDLMPSANFQFVEGSITDYEVCKKACFEILQ